MWVGDDPKAQKKITYKQLHNEVCKIANGLKEIENLINNFLNVRNSFVFESVEKGFIKADVIKYNDYIKFGSELKVKEAGKLKTEGKEYVVIDGDIINFKFNT